MEPSHAQLKIKDSVTLEERELVLVSRWGKSGTLTYTRGRGNGPSKRDRGLSCG